MNKNSSKKLVVFENVGFWMVALLLLAFIGFWDSYFSKLFVSNSGFNIYFHFHAVMAVLWIVVLIVQPILIRHKKWIVHKQVGFAAHFLLALFFISVILLTHYQQSNAERANFIGVFIPFKDLLVISVAYFIAMKNSHVVGIHARGMIVTGIAMIEPALIRGLGALFPSLDNRYVWTILIVYSVLIFFIIISRQYKKGRWVFPLILALYLPIHSVSIFKLPVGLFKNFGNKYPIVFG